LRRQHPVRRYAPGEFRQSTPERVVQVHRGAPFENSWTWKIPVHLGAPLNCGVNMALLKAESTREKDAHRVFPVTIKLTEDERRRVTAYAQSQRVARGQWMRSAVLIALEKPAGEANIALNEIVGVQLLLMNVLKPIAIGQPLTAAAFDSLVAEVHKLKRSVARKLVQEK
jgi:hypothetical protein